MSGLMVVAVVLSVVCACLVLMVWALLARVGRDSEWKGAFLARFCEIAFRQPIAVPIDAVKAGAPLPDGKPEAGDAGEADSGPGR